MNAVVFVEPFMCILLVCVTLSLSLFDDFSMCECGVLNGILVVVLNVDIHRDYGVPNGILEQLCMLITFDVVLHWICLIHTAAL